MTSRRKPYKTYTREFKIEAVRLMAESDRPSSELAAELGIRRNKHLRGHPLAYPCQ